MPVRGARGNGHRAPIQTVDLGLVNRSWRQPGQNVPKSASAARLVGVVRASRGEAARKALSEDRITVREITEDREREAKGARGRVGVV